MDAMAAGDDRSEEEASEANQLLDETQRLRHKRDLLTKENEQLKTYLRLRQMESTATCEQLKSEIEQQIEQFEALGDNQTNHLETLKSFRSEIEAIQCWNAKIRNKYFARSDANPTIAEQLTDEYIDRVVAQHSGEAGGSGGSGGSGAQPAVSTADAVVTQACDNTSDGVVKASDKTSDDKKQRSCRHKRKAVSEVSRKKRTSSIGAEEVMATTSNRIMTRSRQLSADNSASVKKRKPIDTRSGDKTTPKTSKRKKTH